MIFRYARHTSNLQKIKQFYTEVVGLTVLGHFSNHDSYDGLILGTFYSDWHLEFTTSASKPESSFDSDDLLVFYVCTEIEMFIIKKQLNHRHIPIETAKNPYWRAHSLMISDPDGHKIVFSLKHFFFKQNGELTPEVLKVGLRNFNDCLEYIRNLPYGRNSNRHDLGLVIKENKGTCSSKHAFIAQIAKENEISGVKLIMGIYKMNGKNTPNIERLISDFDLEYIPEAHCYLKINNRRIDITSPISEISQIENDILEEIEIEPYQVATFKVETHMAYIKAWLKSHKISLTFDKIWDIREQCIETLESPKPSPNF